MYLRKKNFIGVTPGAVPSMFVKALQEDTVECEIYANSKDELVRRTW